MPLTAVDGGMLGIDQSLNTWDAAAGKSRCSRPPVACLSGEVLDWEGVVLEPVRTKKEARPKHVPRVQGGGHPHETCG